MEIKRIGTQPSAKGPANWFTGTVRVDPLFDAPDPARAAGASVTFEPGARTAWHTHPLGQTLIIVSGCGWAQREGGPVEEIRPGDVVWFAPGEALARRDADDGYDPHRHPGKAQRQPSGLDGESQRRTVPQVTKSMARCVTLLITPDWDATTSRDLGAQKCCRAKARMIQ